MPGVIAADWDGDSISVPVLQALAVELAVVLSDVPGLTGIARPEFAVAVPPSDHRALAAALAELLARPIVRTGMGQAGRQFACEHANLATGVARLSALLEDGGPT